MKNFTNFVKKVLLSLLIFTFIFSFLNVGFFSFLQKTEVQAAGSLINNGSFEGDIYDDWGLWQNPNSTRTYNFYRAYTSAFGYGSYSAVIDAAGASENQFNAILSSSDGNNNFQVQSGSDYILSFYAMATEATDINVYLQRADNYDSITNFPSRTITANWQKIVINLSPSVTADAILAFACGTMPNGATLYIDGVNLIESNFIINTTEVKGKIGDKNKNIRISNIGNFEEADVAVELPYFNSVTGKAETKKFNPVSLNANRIYIDLWEGTYSGIGRIYIDEIYIGEFNYNIIPVIDEYFPVSPRADEDLVIYGSGFIPLEKNTFLVTNTINIEGKVSQTWIEPDMVDSELSQMVVRLPYGSVSGSMYIQTSFLGKGGADVINKSNNTNYKVKPIIFENGVEWKNRGYEHVGDELLIHGKGMGKTPTVIFYNEFEEKIDTKRAKLIQIYDHEIIEVNATKKYNNVNLTVVSGGVESDIFSALNYTAKPRITLIKSKYSRTVYSSSEKVQAAKIGDIITVNGESLRSNSGQTLVEFQGASGRFTTAIGPEEISKQGKSLTVAVPNGAQSGFLAVIVNGQASNYVPYEIVPVISSIAPNPLSPGEEMVIMAQGVGSNINLAKIYFEIDNKNELCISPSSINYSGNEAVIRAIAPMAISNNSTEVTVQYDRWRSNGDTVLNVNPAITSASINLDNKILSIRGYGFSVNSKENVITYKYADENQTIINPSIRMLGVYSTEEGQEIRVQILDDYYYGYVSVTVGGATSNEANFGPVSIRKLTRRIEFIESVGQEMGVLYISGYNFGSEGGVLAGDHWADIHYRSDFFIIAVVDQQYVYDNPVIVARQ